MARLPLSLVLAALLLLAGCSAEEDDPPPPPPPLPVIDDINSSSDPMSPVGVAIEIAGSGFLGAPGSVRFDDGAAPVDVTPNPAGWSDGSIVVVVPATFVPPLTVTVTVTTAYGTSNGLDLDLVAVPAFTPDNLSWGASTPLPEGLRGLRAAGVPAAADRAYVYVTGGQTGATSPENRAACRFLGVNLNAGAFSEDGSWTDVTSLPETRAFHAAVAAHGGNSAVTAGHAHLYVIGGQALAADGTAGTDAVYRAAVNLSDGSLGPWTATASLPAARWGHAALVYRGILYVLGGYDAAGAPQDTVYQSAILADGSLDAFAPSAHLLPTGIGSLAATAFGGFLYVVGGETTSSLDPNDSAVGGELPDALYAPLSGGVVGSFTTTGTTTIGKRRKKHVLWNSFGQLVVAEGVYAGALGSNEMMSTDINANGTLGAWEGLTGANVANADIFNGAAALSPLSPSTGPRFFLIGGDDFAGNAVGSVWVNTAP